MRDKFRISLVTCLAAVSLIACGTDTDETLPDNDNEETTEAHIVEADTENENEEATSTQTSQETKESAADTDEEHEDAEETSDTTEEELEKEIEPSGEEVTDEEEIELTEQLALSALVEQASFEKENYRFFITNAEDEDYIEIEVRENTSEDEEYMPLEGTYRYIVSTKDIEVRDYLTGEFVEYEK